MKLNPNKFFFYYSRGAPALWWWVAPHDDKGMGTRPWNRQIRSGWSVLTDGWAVSRSPDLKGFVWFLSRHRIGKML